MKKIFSLLLFTCSIHTIAKAQYSFAYFPANTYMFTQHKPDPHTLAWLYNVAKTKGFELYDEVQQNKAFYIKALKEQMYDLKEMLNGGNKNYDYRTIASASFGALLSSSMLFGSTVLVGAAIKGLPNIKKYRRYENVGISIIMTIFTGLSAYLLHLSKKYLLKSLRTKTTLFNELKRDIRILRALEAS